MILWQSIIYIYTYGLCFMYPDSIPVIYLVPPISTLSTCRQRNAATSSASWRTSRRSCLAPIRRWERINCGYVGDILDKDIYIYIYYIYYIYICTVIKYTHRFIGWYLHYVSMLRICGYCTVRDIQWYIYIYVPWNSKPYKNVGYEKTQGFSTKPDVFKFAVLMVKREMNRIILFQHIPAFLAATANKHVVGKLLVLLNSLLTTG